MRGTRVKKLRREAAAVYMEYYKKQGRSARKLMLPFKSVFRQVKQMYNAGLPIFKNTRVGM